MHPIACVLVVLMVAGSIPVAVAVINTISPFIPDSIRVIVVMNIIIPFTVFS